MHRSTGILAAPQLSAAVVFPRHWGIQSAQLLAETHSSRIWTVILESGDRAVVKEIKPFDDMADEVRGAHYLSWRAGCGAVRLLDIDGSNMLLEHAGDRLLSEELNIRGDVHATEIICDVLQQILSPSSEHPPAALQPLKERFSSLFHLASWSDVRNPNAHTYGEAARLANELLADQRDVRPLHADIHHDNIIQGARGWLVIDPKGVYGDPAFEAANVFFNPLDRDDLCADPGRIARLAESLARVIAQDPTRLLDHAIAYGCLSAAWHAGDSNRVDEERELRIVAAIRDVRGRI